MVTGALPADPLEVRLERARRRGLVSSWAVVPNSVPQMLVVTTAAGDEWVGRMGAQAHAYLTGLHQGVWLQQQAGPR